ncbi:MAG: UDP-N-acetylmuramoyl-L-alanyl-D-glutamate--2,6-diaminopimelate ligase, partial [Pseudomonadota bacterium]|nr:UDP-N-acetylmuramoyl-L-alanyl-D-glutamate--2,6-diaminopimelate ligase [Pseudomonadota bacterium]
MRLSELLPIPAQADNVISGLALDSRHIQPGYVFLALQGHKTHGEHYIQIALERGAQAILKEATTAELTWLNHHIPCISVPQLSQKVGHLAAHFYGYPAKQLRVIGVTGTNGKTSTTHFIAQLLPRCGLIGTLGYGLYGALNPGFHTTPDALQLQALLAQFQAQKISHVVMEVSSHALAQGRVNAIDFEVAVFTNLTRDHLDYHSSMSAYGQAKQKLFTTPGLKTAIINQDDAFGRQLCTQLPTSVVALTYGLQTTADVYAHIHTCDAQGYQVQVHTPWGSSQIQIPLIGYFNLSNVLAALTVLLQWDLPLAELAPQVSKLNSLPGRMHCLGQHP